MKYRFIIDYTPTDPAGVTSQRVCSPTYGDDLSVNIEMESDEWYRKRKLDGKLTFLREDYEWIMGCAFDGTFKLTVQSSTDGGATWQNYIEGTFSRANLEIDEDNQNVVLNGLNEGSEYNVIENGKSEEYDLMKIIPDADAKEVQGEVHPALAMVDYNTTNIEHSDIFCDAAITAAGYDSKHPESGFNVGERVTSDDNWNFRGVFAEAQMVEYLVSDANGFYSGVLSYHSGPAPAIDYYLSGTLYGPNGFYMVLGWGYHEISGHDVVRRTLRLYDSNDIEIEEKIALPQYDLYDNISPSSLKFGNVNIYCHYIRATLLTQSGGNADNVLDTGDYYKRMAAFNNQDGGLTIAITTNTVEQPNGHRLVPGTGEQGTTPQYFAPPDETEHWIPLCEYEWQYGSMWYTIEPSVANGLLDPTKVGSFRWSRCWTLGTCIDRLLRKISNDKVTFDQSEAGSQFLYSAVNPLTQGEPFEYLFTQKSNVMRPGQGDTGESAARCIVRLEWFLEFLRNGLNCYWWLEERNGGTYAFRVEHVEWFRRGGSYTGQMDAQFDLTEIKTRRNFLRNGNAVKRLDDQLHKYSYEMNGMTEKYTFSWQGDGGSDAFKGNPMFFKAGWVEKGTSESHEVDNIFADLSWLMLNAGSETESAKNYDGIFAFSGYAPARIDVGRENSHPTEQTLVIAQGDRLFVSATLWVTIPQGYAISVNYDNGSSWSTTTYTGTGNPQPIVLNYIGGSSVEIDFGANYSQVTIHRFHAGQLAGSVYNVPNVTDLLNPDNYLQNGPLAWPWLQNEYLHYDIPARMWAYKSDDLDELNENGWWEPTGTVKMRKKQEVPLLPLPTKSDEEDLDKGVIGGLKDSHGQLQTGIVKSATINLGTRNATLTLMYDMIS